MINSKDTINFYISGKYRNSLKIKAWIDATGSQLRDMSVTYEDMTYNIDKARGEQLDFIGELVDIERVSIPNQHEHIGFFGYEGVTSATGYGVFPYLDESTGNLVKLSDKLYRVAIKAKIILNTTDSSLDEGIRLADAICGVDTFIIDNEDMTIEIEILDDLPFQRELIMQYYDLYRTPAGVRFLGYRTNDNRIIRANAWEK